jgi:hypothetical protein
MCWRSYPRCRFELGAYMEYTPMQYEILKTVFRQMDQELGIKPLTDEQIKAFKIKLEELDETDE